MSKSLLVFMLSAALLTSHVVICATSDRSIDNQDHQLRVSHKTNFTSKQFIETESKEVSAAPKPDWQKSSHVIKEEIRATSSVLDWFVARLRSFIIDDVFDKERFEYIRTPMGEDLDAIWKRADETLFDAYLENQLNFATYFYREMEDCANILNFCIFNQTEQYIIRWVAGLNLTLLTLFKPCGYPDPTAPGYADIIKRSRRLLMFWDSIYSEMEKVALSFVIMFERKFTQAENLLRHLESAWDDEEMR